MRISSGSIRLILFVDGLLLVVLSCAMLVPMILDFTYGNRDWQVFAASGFITMFVGSVVAISNVSRSGPVDRQTGFLLTVSAWLVIGFFASLPLFFSSLKLSYTDAFFEAMSGLTTTGSTVIVGLDRLPPGLLLWRSLLQWIGGVGIVVMAIVLLPVLRTGGMQLFRTESSDISGKPFSRPLQIAGITVVVYVVLSVACALSYGIAGMNAFDAINHAMTTLATGGFSTKDASLGYYDSVTIENVAIVFMVAGALPLIWYARIMLEPRRGARPEGRQVPAFIAVLLVAILAVTFWNVYANDMTFRAALRVSAVNVTSVLTDTGYATSDFAAWGSFAVGLFFMLYLVGGCAGSTAGSIKIFRWQILFASIARQLRLVISPHRILVTRYGSQAVDEEMLQSVRNFFFMYIITLFGLSLLVMATGIDFLSSISAVAQAMANAGPGLGPLGGPAGNFSTFPDAAKWLLVAGMLLGRLELSTVYVLLLTDYWKS